MIAMISQNWEFVTGSIAFASHWGYTMHRLKAMELAIAKLSENRK